MKSVLGTVISSKSVSLSKAARILSKFASSDNGASPAFAAYLKRASASFDELVPLHKELLVGAGFEHKGKKHLSGGNVNEETINSVGKPSEDGLLTEEKQGIISERERNEGEAREVEVKKRRDDGEGSSGTRAEVENIDGKKLKKKRKKSESDDVVAIVDKNQTYGDADEVKNDSGRQNVGTETSKKKKKKKKRGKDEQESTDGALKSDKEEKTVENDGSEQKKHKKKKKKGKEEKESSAIAVAEQRDRSDGGDGKADEARAADNQFKIEGSEGKKHTKKPSHDKEETGEKESRKRKHKGDANGGLDDSEEQHRSKKKKKAHG